jgi:hypothetical protein
MEGVHIRAGKCICFPLSGSTIYMCPSPVCAAAVTFVKYVIILVCMSLKSSCICVIHSYVVSLDYMQTNLNPIFSPAANQMM